MEDRGNWNPKGLEGPSELGGVQGTGRPSVVCSGFGPEQPEKCLLGLVNAFISWYMIWLWTVVEICITWWWDRQKMESDTLKSKFKCARWNTLPSSNHHTCPPEPFSKPLSSEKHFRGRNNIAWFSHMTIGLQTGDTWCETHHRKVKMQLIPLLF